MAKKAVSILLILLLCWPALAEGGADREAYEAVMAAEHIALRKRWRSWRASNPRTGKFSPCARI